MGVPPARPVPGQVVRDLGRVVGHAARRDTRSPGPRAAQEPAPLEYLREDPWALDLDLEIELNGTVIARTERAPPVLVGGPAARAPDGQRRLAARRRPLRLGHHLGPRARAARLACSSWRGTGRSRSSSPTGRRAASCSTATRSSCAGAAATPSHSAGSAGGSSRRLMALPKAIRRLAPDRLRDDVRLRSVFVGAGLIPPRTIVRRRRRCPAGDGDRPPSRGRARGLRGLVGRRAVRGPRAPGPNCT